MATPADYLKEVKQNAISLLPPIDDSNSLPGYIKLAHELAITATHYIERGDSLQAYAQLVRLIVIVNRIHHHRDARSERFREQMKWCEAQAENALDWLEQKVKPAAMQVAEQRLESQRGGHHGNLHTRQPVLSPASVTTTRSVAIHASVPAAAPSGRVAYPSLSYLPDGHGAGAVHPHHDHGQHSTHGHHHHTAAGSTILSSPALQTPIGTFGSLLQEARGGHVPAGQAHPPAQPHGAAVQEEQGMQRPKPVRQLSYGALTRVLLSSGSGPLQDLRPLQLPADLVDTFEGIARPQTLMPPRGIETCGILCGKVCADPDVPGGEIIRVTTLAIPEHTSGPDNCEVTEAGELSLLSLCQREGLLSVGWIHTHPSQDCFMSSLDCHTHCGYQSLLPEAVAVVLSPNSPSGRHVGLFRLTDEPTAAGQQAGSDLTGLSLVQSCTQKGFHAHPDGIVIYEGCEHVRFGGAGSGAVQVRDLRPGRG